MEKWEEAGHYNEELIPESYIGTFIQHLFELTAAKGYDENDIVIRVGPREEMDDLRPVQWITKISDVSADDFEYVGDDEEVVKIDRLNNNIDGWEVKDERNDTTEDSVEDDGVSIDESASDVYSPGDYDYDSELSEEDTDESSYNHEEHVVLRQLSDGDILWYTDADDKFVIKATVHRFAVSNSKFWADLRLVETKYSKSHPAETEELVKQLNDMPLEFDGVLLSMDRTLAISIPVGGKLNIVWLRYIPEEELILGKPRSLVTGMSSNKYPTEWVEDMVLYYKDEDKNIFKAHVVNLEPNEIDGGSLAVNWRTDVAGKQLVIDWLNRYRGVIAAPMSGDNYSWSPEGLNTAVAWGELGKADQKYGRLVYFGFAWKSADDDHKAEEDSVDYDNWYSQIKLPDFINTAGPVREEGCPKVCNDTVAKSLSEGDTLWYSTPNEEYIVRAVVHRQAKTENRFWASLEHIVTPYSRSHPKETRKLLKALRDKYVKFEKELTAADEQFEVKLPKTVLGFYLISEDDLVDGQPSSIAQGITGVKYPSAWTTDMLLYCKDSEGTLYKASVQDVNTSGLEVALEVVWDQITYESASTAWATNTVHMLNILNSYCRHIKAPTSDRISVDLTDRKKYLYVMEEENLDLADMIYQGFAWKGPDDYLDDED